MTIAPSLDPPPDFWLTSGFHLLQREPSGWLGITEDYLRAYLQRPELLPVPESCAAELALREDLLARPSVAVPESRLADFADPDARDNYRVLLGFRDHLLAHGTLEAGYLALFGGAGPFVPPLFIDQMVHAILRNILDGCDDPIRVRAAELLFRTQAVTVKDGTIMLADDETVEMHAAASGLVPLGQLLQGAEPATRTIELDILDPDNAAEYWGRSDSFNTALDVSFTKPGLDALCRVLDAWLRHFLRIDVTIYPVQSIRDERWRWHVGLDAEVTGILNDLYEGRTVEEPRLARLLSLFRMEFAGTDRLLPDVAGRPVYLGMAMNAKGKLRLKPQNLLVNLPLVRPL